MLVTNVLGEGSEGRDFGKFFDYLQCSRCKMVPCLTNFEAISSSSMPYFGSVSSKVRGVRERVFPPSTIESAGTVVPSAPLSLRPWKGRYTSFVKLGVTLPSSLKDPALRDV